jgi:hypothetical protein
MVTLLGSTDLFGKDHRHTNVDWVFVAISFATLLIFPSLAIVYARSRKADLLLHASFSRGFLGGWWTDPLQCLRVTTLLLCGTALGSLFTLPQASPQGMMIVWWFAALAVGSIAGEAFALYKFRRSIA